MENFKFLDLIFSAHFGLVGDLEKDYVMLERAKESSSKVFDELAKNGISDRDVSDELDSALVAVESEYERQGFINGFRMGVRLMQECIGPVPVDALSKAASMNL